MNIEGLDDLFKNRERLERELKQIKNRINEVNKSIYEMTCESLDRDFSLKKDGCGTVSFATDCFDCKANITKKVEYDQSGLAKLYDQIVESGDDPSKYIDLKYNVKEKDFKSWDNHIQQAFVPYRTIKKSPVKITVKEKAE